MFGRKKTDASSPTPPAKQKPRLAAPPGVLDDAENKFAEIFGGAKVAQQRMFLVAMSSILVALTSIWALYSVAKDNVAIPYLIEFDNVTGVLNKPIKLEHVTPSAAVLKAELARWAVKVFTIDKELTVRYFREANAMTSGLGVSQFTEFRLSQNVFERIAKDPAMQRIPTVTSVDVSQPGVAFIFVQAKEARINNASVSTSSFRVTVKYQFVPPTTDAAIMENPLGLFITSMNVSEEKAVK